MIENRIDGEMVQWKWWDGEGLKSMRIKADIEGYGYNRA
jgi:hypothetical protein